VVSGGCTVLGRERERGGRRTTYFEVWLEAGGFHGGDEVGEFFALGPGRHVGVGWGW
jgi:hypothetical protein